MEKGEKKDRLCLVGSERAVRSYAVRNAARLEGYEVIGVISAYDIVRMGRGEKYVMCGYSMSDCVGESVRDAIAYYLEQNGWDQIGYDRYEEER
jgi:hypothetical protein